MSKGQRDSDQEYFCSDAVRGKTFAITNGPDIEALCRALGETVDIRHPDWPMGYRTVYFKVHKEMVHFVHLVVAVTGLVWENPDYKGRCVIHGFVGNVSNKVRINYTLFYVRGCDQSVRTGKITF